MPKAKEIAVVELDPAAMPAETPADRTKRGWAYLAKQQFDRATEDFQAVVSAEPANIDTWFALGLALKGSGATTKAVSAFEKVLELIGSVKDSQRAAIQTRLTHGHINQLKTGDWNLEKEVWKRVA